MPQIRWEAPAPTGHVEESGQERHVIEPYSSDFGRNPSNALIGALAQAMAQRLGATVEWDCSVESRDYLFCNYCKVWAGIALQTTDGCTVYELYG